MADEKIKEIAKQVDELRGACPLMHCITNVVTVHECANAALAVGASPIMANEEAEAEEITSIASSLVVNIGTLTKSQINTMKISTKTAGELNKKFVLDPVGIGVSQIRNDTAIDLIKLNTPTIIRGNLSEIKAIATFYGILEECSQVKGVDVAEGDVINEETLEYNSELIRNIAAKLETTVAVSGKIDIISDGKEVYAVDNGDAVLSSITGTGCMLATIMGAYAAVTTPLNAAICATLVMTISGEIAAEKMRKNDEGTGSFNVYLTDEFYKMTPETMMKYANLKKVL